MDYDREEVLAQLNAETDELRRDLEARRERRLRGEEPAGWQLPEPEPKRVSEIDLRTMALRHEMAQGERKLLDAVAQATAHERRAMREHVAKAMTDFAAVMGEEVGTIRRDLQNQINALKTEIETLKTERFAKETELSLDWNRMRSQRKAAA